MKFDTDAERMQHPQAGLIPRDIWEWFFDGELSELQLSLTQVSPEALISHLKFIDIYLLPNKREKQALWLCIALSHPTMTDAELQTIAQVLHMSLKDVLIASAAIGKLTLFNQVIANDSAVVDSFAENEYEIFIVAALSGHLTVINRLVDLLTPAEVQNAIKAQNYGAFWRAATNGHVNVIDRFVTLLTPAEVQNAIKGKGYWAFSGAAQSGHLAVINCLVDLLTPAEVQNAIKGEGYLAFRGAAQNGYLAVINRFVDLLAPAEVQNAIKALDYRVFRQAARYGHLAVIDRLVTLAPEEVQNAIKAGDYGAFRGAAENGHLDVIDRLVTLAPAEVQNAIKARDYGAFTEAAANGHPTVIDRLVDLAPAEVKNAIKADDYRAFWEAAGNGHLAVIDRLVTLAPEEVQNVVTAEDYRAFRWVVDRGQIAVANRLLSFPAVFAYAEQHEYEYGVYVQSFSSEKISALRTQRQAIEDVDPHAIFDITNPEEAKFCFYMMRNIIRRNDRALDDDLRFLLDIPAVKALAHTAVTPEHPNELVQLALTTGNAAAAAILLNIPAVRTLAEQNNYYIAEARGELDLRALAHDRESSMNALTTGEQARLQAVINTYQPIIEQAGIDHVMQSLRQALIERYHQHPATISLDDNNKELKLPLDWQDFNALHLNASQREEALQAYYQHKDHTALRYLSTPNHWMAENASYVYINPDNRNERWSTFEEYQPLITMFWLAAIDKKEPPVDGHTLEGRIDHFIDELAHIGRAHNWDKTRVKVDAKNKPSLDQHDKEITEEYDDAEGDKPSCYSGVKRRLFQSVVGNPLLVMLTDDIINQEITEFVYRHFKDAIHPTHQNALHAALESIMEGEPIPEGAFHTLKTLDISNEKLNTFIENLVQKYGEQAKTYQTKITRKFLLPEKNELESNRRTHFFMFYSVANLSGLIVSPVASAAATVSQIGLFATPGENEQKQKPAAQPQETHTPPQSPRGKK